MRPYDCQQIICRQNGSKKMFIDKMAVKNVCRQNGCRQNDCRQNNIDSINVYRISPGGTRMIEILTVNETK